VKAQLIVFGTADPKIERAGYRDGLCGEVSMASLDTRVWPSFSVDRARARPVAATIL